MTDLDTLTRLAAAAHLDTITRDNLVTTAMFGNFSTQEAIVVACNAVPALLARIAALEADVAHLRKQLPLAQEGWPITYTRDEDTP